MSCITRARQFSTVYLICPEFQYRYYTYNKISQASCVLNILKQPIVDLLLIVLQSRGQISLPISKIPINLYTNTAIAFNERCFGYTLRLSACRQSAVSHTSGKN